MVLNEAFFYISNFLIVKMNSTVKCAIFLMLGLMLLHTQHARALSTTATPSGPPQNNYTVTDDNITCVVMTTSISLTIPYEGETKNSTALFNIPDTATTSGSCIDTPGQNTLQIQFYNTWTLSFIFTNASNSTVHLHDVTLTYVMGNTKFPNVSSSQENETVTLTTWLPDGILSTPLAGSYMCTGDTTIALNNSIVLTLSNLQYRALGDNNSTWFTEQDITNCDVSMSAPETDVALAVSLGIALGVMITVVVLLYLVVSKAVNRRGKRYDSVR